MILSNYRELLKCTKRKKSHIKRKTEIITPTHMKRAGLIILSKVQLFMTQQEEMTIQVQVLSHHFSLTQTMQAK